MVNKMDKKELRKRQSKKNNKYAILAKNDPEAFEFFFAGRRNYSEVARKFNISHNAVRAHALKNDWKGRFERRLEAVREKTDSLVTTKVAKHNVQTVQIARALKTVVGGLIKQGHITKENGEIIIKLKSKEAKELSETLNNASKIERLVLGESTDKSEHSDTTWKDIITAMTSGNGHTETI